MIRADAGCSVWRFAELVGVPRRNRVWQVDFSQLETTTEGTWKLCPVVDYATKLVLACPVAPTQTAAGALQGVVERWIETLKYEHHWCHDIPSGPAPAGGSRLSDFWRLRTHNGSVFPASVVLTRGFAGRVP